MATQKKKPTSARKTAANKTVKRKRKSQPLFAEVDLKTLKDLLGNDNDAKVTVSRNFVMDLQTEQLQKEAQKKLGIS